MTLQCDVCGHDKATAYIQTLLDGRKTIVYLCRDHAKSRRALGYTLRPTSK